MPEKLIKSKQNEGLLGHCVVLLLGVRFCHNTSKTWHRQSITSTTTNKCQSISQKCNFKEFDHQTNFQNEVSWVPSPSRVSRLHFRMSRIVISHDNWKQKMKWVWNRHQFRTWLYECLFNSLINIIMRNFSDRKHYTHWTFCKHVFFISSLCRKDFIIIAFNYHRWCPFL